jgi:hypothetical protein
MDLKNILGISFYLVFFLFGWWCCSLRYSTLIANYKLKAEQDKNLLLSEIKNKERVSRETIANIERENLKKEEDLKHEYETIINDLNNKYVLVGGVQCNDPRDTNDVQRKKDNTPQVRCYTENELYRKIEQSLDIAKDCDKLANDYNALLKVCKID